MHVLLLYVIDNQDRYHVYMLYIILLYMKLTLHIDSLVPILKFYFIGEIVLHVGQVAMLVL